MGEGNEPVRFTASNGITFTRAEDGIWRWEAGNAPALVTNALRELFAHERDEELGRWRYPDDRDYVVYPVGSGEVVHVLNEKAGVSGQYGMAEVNKVFGGEFLETADPLYSRAARAYFEAHPERKPLDGAKVGELWELTMDDGSEHTVFIHEDRAVGGRDAVSPGGAYFDIDDGAGVTAARRIWPESEVSRREDAV